MVPVRLKLKDGKWLAAEAVKAGNAGFLTKDKAPQQLIAAIRSAARGDVLLTPAQWARIRAWEKDVGARWQRLSARERDVLVLLAQGKTTAEIAAALLITENTVRTHVGNLLGKLKVDCREAALAWAWKHGFVEGKGVCIGSLRDASGRSDQIKLVAPVMTNRCASGNMRVVCKL